MNINPLLRIQKYKVSLTSLGINSNISSSLRITSSLQLLNVLEMCSEMEEQAEMNQILLYKYEGFIQSHLNQIKFLEAVTVAFC